MSKWLKNSLILGGAVLAGLAGVLAITNPNRQTYEEFATEQLMIYAKQELCEDVSQDLGGFLSRSCETFVEVGRDPARQLIRQQTEQQNFGLFSIYKTDLSVDEFIPSDLISLIGETPPAYHVESVGILQQFIIYRIEEQNR